MHLLYAAVRAFVPTGYRQKLYSKATLASCQSPSMRLLLAATTFVIPHAATAGSLDRLSSASIRMEPAHIPQYASLFTIGSLGRSSPLARDHSCTARPRMAGDRRRTCGL